MNQTYYLCRACNHPDNLHDTVGDRPCKVTRDGCLCTAYQVPVLFGEEHRNSQQAGMAIEDLARLGSQLDDPAGLVALVGLLTDRLITKRFEAAGKRSFRDSERRARFAITELLHAVLTDVWRGHEADVDLEGTSYLKSYQETVNSRPWWG